LTKSDNALMSSSCRRGGVLSCGRPDVELLNLLAGRQFA
jgi:hypothetical protein